MVCSFPIIRRLATKGLVGNSHVYKHKANTCRFHQLKHDIKCIDHNYCLFVDDSLFALFVDVVCSAGHDIVCGVVVSMRVSL